MTDVHAALWSTQGKKTVVTEVYASSIWLYRMAGSAKIYVGVAVAALVGAIVYMLDPTLAGALRRRAPAPRGYEGFDGSAGANADAAGDSQAAGSHPVGVVESSGDAADHYKSVAAFDTSINPTGDAGNQVPNNCFPRQALTPSELLPKDTDSVWAQVNPQGQGDLAGKNFLSAGYNLGVQTVGTSRRNPNMQIRSDPPCPQVAVSPWLQSTIQPDLFRRPLEIN